MTEMPSSADVASITSIARPCSSCTSARAARPSAVAAPNSSSTTSARMLNRLMLRWIISTPSPCRSRLCLSASWLLQALHPSLRRRGAPEEERARGLVEVAEPLAIDLGKVGGRVEPAQGAINQQTEVVVSARQRERERLMREQAREDCDLPHRRFIHRPQHHGAIAEQHVDLAVEQLLQAHPVVRDHNGRGVDLERIELSREPAFRRGAGDDCEGGLFDQLGGGRAPPDRPLWRRLAERLA